MRFAETLASAGCFGYTSAEWVDLQGQSEVCWGRLLCKQTLDYAGARKNAFRQSILQNASTNPFVDTHLLPDDYTAEPLPWFP